MHPRDGSSTGSREPALRQHHELRNHLHRPKHRRVPCWQEVCQREDLRGSERRLWWHELSGRQWRGRLLRNGPELHRGNRPDVPGADRDVLHRFAHPM